MHMCGWFDYGTVQLRGSAIAAYGFRGRRYPLITDRAREVAGPGGLNYFRIALQ